MQKITPFLWFYSKAEEAVNFYVSVFKNSKILNVARYGKAGPGPEGSVTTVRFHLEREAIWPCLRAGPCHPTTALVCSAHPTRLHRTCSKQHGCKHRSHGTQRSLASDEHVHKHRGHGARRLLDALDVCGGQT